MKKCTKCDERGMITEVKNGSHYGYSCDCGKYHKIMEEKFKGVSIEDLLSYASNRVEDKQTDRSLLGKLMGSIKSEKKAKSSAENGKKGGRPKKVK